MGLLHNTYGMVQENIKMSSKYSAVYSKLLIVVSPEKIWRIDIIQTTSWSMQLLQDLYYIRKWKILNIHTETTMNGLTNKITVHL